jgi:hypothetical protein
MDWFERLTGFRETSWGETRSRLAMQGDRLISRDTAKSWGAGRFELPSLEELRARRSERPGANRALRLTIAQGDVGDLHGDPANAGALFQVASQFNALEMIGPNVTPEEGVTRYQNDPTQGPVCAVAAGAATIYRNYFVPCGGGEGQTATRQLDALADLGAEIGRRLDLPVRALWEMRNGYCLSGASMLAPVTRLLRRSSEDERDALRGALRIGLHWDVEVTRAPGPTRPVVSQAFCSALPISYCDAPPAAWEPFARLVLEAAYEATLRAATLNLRRGGSSRVFLTLLGGGVFGNEEAWIFDAIARAVETAAREPLDVRIVSYRDPSPQFREFVAAYA